MWKEVNWSLSIQGLRFTAQDMHVDALWLLQHETRGRTGLKGVSGADIRSCSGLRTVCATYSRFCLPQTWVDALKSWWGGLRGRETAKQSKTASFKWKLKDFSLTGRLHQGQSWQRWVRGSWHDSWGCGRVLRVHLLRPLSPHLCHRSISLVDRVAPVCSGVWNWTAALRSADALLTVFAGTVLHSSHWSIILPSLHFFC